ncbi:hypothetical protein IQ782_08290 [Salipiger pacificus]|uniref:RNase NYN domain-containing protein n=2 Tax=Salipiger mangrovisoli TaxID=2865933 RepID=A0ABR9WZW7_9RHOB|nr:hypothetical protein [Salipiger mangrovisoli]
MWMPLFLFALSLAGLAAALILPGLSDVLLLAAPCALASLILLFRARRGGAGRQHIILDGSNVMYWRGDGAELAAVKDTLDSLAARGFLAGVIFDANVGYKLVGRYQGDAELAELLGLPRDRVMVVPKGVPADQIILRVARDQGARIVTNDRYRDWAEAHPEIGRTGHLVPGGYRAGKLWMGMEPEATSQG